MKPWHTVLLTAAISCAAPEARVIPPSTTEGASERVETFTGPSLDDRVNGAPGARGGTSTTEGASERVETFMEWPESSAGLAVLPPRACADPKETVFIMAGHANGRTRNGNIGVHGQVEAEVNLDAALRLGEALEATGCFEVVQGRTGEAGPSYGARIRHAERVEADAFIELHTDARGPIWPWARTPDGWAYRAEGALGFAVLYNRRNHVPGIAEGRRALARAVTRSLRVANFEPFPAYNGMYEPDEEVGAHIDLRGLKMLREPEVPSIIIETHNAKHFEESLRWREDRVNEAFAAAIADGLVTLFEGPREPEPCTVPPVVSREVRQASR